MKLVFFVLASLICGVRCKDDDTTISIITLSTTVTPTVVTNGNFSSTSNPNTSVSTAITVQSTSVTATDNSTSATTNVFTGDNTVSSATSRENSTTTTEITKSSSASSTSPIVTTSTKAPSSSRFDAGSFVGGIALGVGIVLIAYFAFKCFRSKKKPDYNTL